MSEENQEIKDVNGIDASRLLSFIEKIERLEEEKKAIQSDIKGVFDEAKEANFDVKAMKEIIKLRKKDDMERQEEDFMLDTYKTALGMV